MSNTWQPYWLPLHAYVVGAVVLPTTWMGYLWRCTTPGTSGGAEPAWPDPITGVPTIADGGVVWSLGTGFRQALQIGLMKTMTDFATANPTIVHSVLSQRPKTLNQELPMLYIGDMVETITIPHDIWTRNFTVEVFYADVQPEPSEVNSRQNFIVDALAPQLVRDFHSANPRAITEPIEAGDFRDEFESTVPYAIIRFVLRGYETLGTV